MLTLSRRQTLQAMGAAPALAALAPLPLGAQTAAPAQAPGYYRRRVGGLTVTALLDGYFDLPDPLWLGLEAGTLPAARLAAGLPETGATTIGVTSYLVDTGTSRILVDAGAAAFFGPTAGRFLSVLAQAGYAPGDIDHILCTHLHLDHVGTLVEGGVRVFDRAQVHAHAADHAYWTSEVAQSAAPDFAQGWFPVIRDLARLYDGRLSLFDGATAPLPGVTVMPLPGHTPGHVGFLFEDGGERLLIWGDACATAAVQFAHPEAAVVFDVDPEQGITTRKRLLDMAATERMLVASTHLPFPTFGRVERRGAAFDWRPDEYRYAP